MLNRTVLTFLLFGLLSCKTSPKITKAQGGDSPNLGLTTSQVNPKTKILDFELATLVFQAQKIAQLKMQDLGQDYSEVEACNGDCQYTKNNTATLLLPLSIGTNNLRARACWSYGQTADKEPACGPWSTTKAYEQKDALSPNVSQALAALPILSFGFQEGADYLYQNLQNLEQAVKACPTYDQERFAKVLALRNLASVSMASVLAKQAVFPNNNNASLGLVNGQGGTLWTLMLLLATLSVPPPEKKARDTVLTGADLEAELKIFDSKLSVQSGEVNDSKLVGVLQQIKNSDKPRDIKKIQKAWEEKPALIGKSPAELKRAALLEYQREKIVDACKARYPELVKDKIADIVERAKHGRMTRTDIEWLDRVAVSVDEKVNVAALVEQDQAERARKLAERQALGDAEGTARDIVGAGAAAERAGIMQQEETSRRAALDAELARENERLKALEADQRRLAAEATDQRRLAEAAVERQKLEEAAAAAKQPTADAEAAARKQIADLAAESQRAVQDAAAAEQARQVQEAQLVAERQRAADLAAEAERLRAQAAAVVPSEASRRASTVPPKAQSARPLVPETPVRTPGELRTISERPLNSHSNTKLNVISAAGGIFVAAAAVAVGIGASGSNKTNLTSTCEAQAYDNFNQASTEVNDLSQNVRDARERFLKFLDKSGI